MTSSELALLAVGATCSDKACACLCLQLSNRLFEELAMDVYDEVDRRENDAGELGVQQRLWADRTEQLPAREGLGPGAVLSLKLRRGRAWGCCAQQPA